MKKVIITHYSNVTNKGIVLHTNIPSKLKNGVMPSKSHFISWDKIGRLIFENYTEADSVKELSEMRDKALGKGDANG